AHQPQVGLVQQRGRLQGLAGLFLGQLLGRESAQLVVDQRQELLRGRGVALLDGGQDARDLGHRRHRKGDGLNRTTSPILWGGVRNLSPAEASHRLSRQACPQPGRHPISIPFAWPQVLGFFGTPPVVEPSPAVATQTVKNGSAQPEEGARQEQVSRGSGSPRFRRGTPCAASARRRGSVCPNSSVGTGGSLVFGVVFGKGCGG